MSERQPAQPPLEELVVKGSALDKALQANEDFLKEIHSPHYAQTQLPEDSTRLLHFSQPQTPQERATEDRVRKRAYFAAMEQMGPAARPIYDRALKTGEQDLFTAAADMAAERALAEHRYDRIVEGHARATRQAAFIGEIGTASATIRTAFEDLLAEGRGAPAHDESGFSWFGSAGTSTASSTPRSAPIIPRPTTSPSSMAEYTGHMEQHPSASEPQSHEPQPPIPATIPTTPEESRLSREAAPVSVPPSPKEQVTETINTGTPIPTTVPTTSRPSETAAPAPPAPEATEPPAPTPPADTHPTVEIPVIKPETLPSEEQRTTEKINLYDYVFDPTKFDDNAMRLLAHITAINEGRPMDPAYPALLDEVNKNATYPGLGSLLEDLYKKGDGELGSAAGISLDQKGFALINALREEQLMAQTKTYVRRSPYLFGLVKSPYDRTIDRIRGLNKELNKRPGIPLEWQRDVAGNFVAVEGAPARTFGNLLMAQFAGVEKDWSAKGSADYIEKPIDYRSGRKKVLDTVLTKVGILPPELPITARLKRRYDEITGAVTPDEATEKKLTRKERRQQRRQEKERGIV